MTSLTEFFNKDTGDSSKGVAYKNNLIKRDIIAYMAVTGQCTLAELTRELNVSVPTITKLVGELVVQKIIVDNGKIETSGGRRPNVFGLANTALYFAGISVGFDVINMVITNLENQVIYSEDITDFKLVNSIQCFDTLVSKIDNFLNKCGVSRSKIIGLGFAITCRVNPQTGRSNKYFSDFEQPLSEVLRERLQVSVLLENDTRSRCYAEYCLSEADKDKNFIFLNAGRGVAIGIVIDGKLYYGKSGFAGEFGHTPFFDNEIICACGKKGCLETEISGMALERKMIDKINEGVNTSCKAKYIETNNIHINDIVESAKKDDILAIELIESAGEKIGKSIAFLINIFNPETVVIGGNLACAGDIIMLPIKSAVNKYSLSVVYKDTNFKISTMSGNAPALGVAMLVRNKIIGL
ncbi:MAG: ROK family protein [Rikenellaceae bacterium]